MVVVTGLSSGNRKKFIIVPLQMFYQITDHRRNVPAFRGALAMKFSAGESLPSQVSVEALP
jgi:hypothetical protein